MDDKNKVAVYEACHDFRGRQATLGRENGTVAFDGLVTLTLSIFAFLVLFFSLCAYALGSDTSSTRSVILDGALAKMVKIYGAGGYQRLGDYQSGFLISSDGYVLTAFSSVLDTNNIDVYLSDGRKFEAKFLGADPRVAIAVLKIDVLDLPYFDLAGAAKAELGENMFALSNLFNVAVGNEPLSVQGGIVSAITKLDARRGAYETPYHGTVYVLDQTTNNPGSAGGALVNHRGKLLAVLGKELRDSQNNVWLNYAIPIGELRSTVESICSGKFAIRPEREQSTKTSNPLDLESLGIVLVPDVLERTPPYVDYIFPGSPAEKAGIRPDDLIVLINGRLVQSNKLLRAELKSLDESERNKITVLRGKELIEFDLREPKKKK